MSFEWIEGGRGLGPLCAAALFAAALVVASLGCRQDMHDAPRYEPLEASSFFADGRSARPRVEGAVARGELREDAHFETGWVADEPALRFPFAVTREVLERGRERFDVFCSPCHGRLGDGRGMVVRRGFREPPSYHSDRLRQERPGHFFDVMTNGFGAMKDFSDRIEPRERWAIAAYIRALQLSQSAQLDELPEAVAEEFRRSVRASE